MFSKSPIAKMVHAAVWLIVALNAINTGIMPMGYDFFSSDFVMNNMANMMNILYYIVGVAGVLNLFSFVMCVVKGKGHCENGSARMCSRCGSMSGCSCR